MVRDKTEVARWIAYVYVFLGVVFITLWTFTDIRQYSSLEPLFYVFLPAVLAAPYILLEAFCKRVYGKQTEQIDSEEHSKFDI